MTTGPAMPTGASVVFYLYGRDLQGFEKTGVVIKSKVRPSHLGGGFTYDLVASQSYGGKTYQDIDERFIDLLH